MQQLDRIRSIRGALRYAREHDKTNMIIKIDDLEALIRRIDSLQDQREKLFGYHVFSVGTPYEETVEWTVKALTEFTGVSPWFNDQMKLTLERFDEKA